MKKIKWTIMSLTFCLSICCAFVTKPHFDCSQMQQYYFAGGVYTPAGVEGVDYVCTQGSEACTYYTTNGINYFQCQVGTYCTANCFVRYDNNNQPVKATQQPSPAVNKH